MHVYSDFHPFWAGKLPRAYLARLAGIKVGVNHLYWVEVVWSYMARIHLSDTSFNFLKIKLLQTSRTSSVSATSVTSISQFLCLSQSQSEILDLFLSWIGQFIITWQHQSQITKCWLSCQIQYFPWLYALTSWKVQCKHFKNGQTTSTIYL